MKYISAKCSFCLFLAEYLSQYCESTTYVFKPVLNNCGFFLPLQNTHTHIHTEEGQAETDSACYPSRIGAIISSLASRGESAVIEGVHLTPSVMIHLMERHRNVVPFLLYIKQEQKHRLEHMCLCCRFCFIDRVSTMVSFLTCRNPQVAVLFIESFSVKKECWGCRERFAVRAKHMTLMPAHNRYVKHIKTIRAIHSYLLTEAESYSIPRLSNSNIDRSVSIIHGTIFAAVRKLLSEKSYSLIGHDSSRMTAEPLYRIFKSQVARIASSKAFF